MFVRRIPYQSVRRRRIRHWFLLLMRAAAIALIVAAFARPFFPQGAAAAAAAGGDREVVILLDQSASMGYGDHWPQARDRAIEAIRSLGCQRQGHAWCCSAATPRNRSAPPAIAGASKRRSTPRASTSGATRYGPALKLAESILTRSTLPRREAMLISDFQRAGWSGAEDVHFGEGMTLTPVPIATGKTRESLRAVGRPSRARRSPARSASPSRPGVTNKRRRRGQRRAGLARDRGPRDREAGR